MIDEVIELIESFLSGEMTSLDFKTDIGVIADMDYETLLEENKDIGIIIFEELLCVCNAYEDGGCLMTFMERVNSVYEKIQELV